MSLSKLAQREIHHLKRENDDLRRVIGRTMTEDSPIKWHTVVPHATGPLPDQASVRFTHQENGDVIMVELRKGKVIVRCIDGQLRIAPKVENWIEIWSE